MCPGILVYPWVRKKVQDGNNAQSESTWFTDEPFNPKSPTYYIIHVTKSEACDDTDTAVLLFKVDTKVDMCLFIEMFIYLTYTSLSV